MIPDAQRGSVFSARELKKEGNELTACTERQRGDKGARAENRLNSVARSGRGRRASGAFVIAG